MKKSAFDYITRGIGKHASAVDIPDTATKVALRVSRCTPGKSDCWPNKNTAIAIDVDCSLDGTNWQHLAGFQSEGGVALNKTRTGPALQDSPHGARSRVKCGACNYWAFFEETGVIDHGSN